MPDALWKVFSDPSNQWILGVTLVGLFGATAGPWAIIRLASGRTKAPPDP